MTREGFLIIVWGVALLLAAWVLVPSLAHLLGLWKLRFILQAGPEELWAERNDSSIAPLYRQLEAAGFRPLGRVKQEIVFDGIHWRMGTVVRVYAGSDSFASVYRILAFEPLRFSFSTIFADGSVLSSACSMPNLVIDEPTYHRWAMETNDPAALLAEHRRRVAERLAQGAQLGSHQEIADWEQMGRTESDTKFARTLYRGLAFQTLKILGWWSFILGFEIWRQGMPVEWELGVPAFIMTVVPAYVATVYFFRAITTIKAWLHRKSVAEI